MSEDTKYFDPDFDAMITKEQSHEALMNRLSYEEKRRRWLEDPPEQGRGLDGYPLQK